MKNIKEHFYQIILFILLVIVGYVTYCSIFNIYGSNIKLQPIVLLLGIVVTTFTFIAIKKLAKKISEKRANIIAIILCIIFFMGLSIFGSKLTSIPPYDLSKLQKEAMIMLENGGKIETESYFSKYTQQIPATILIFFIYKLGCIFNLPISLRVFATIINGLFIAITAFFTYLSVKRLKDYKIALTTLIFFIVNPIFYLYVSYFYTDTLSMPFAAGAIYLFILSIQSKKRKISMIALIASGILIAVGMKIRVTVGILLIGMILGCILNKTIKETVLNVIGLISGLLFGIVICFFVLRSFDLPNNKNLEFPVTHWVKMGLNEKSDGKFNSDDHNSTFSKDTYEGKIEENLSTIKERIEDLRIKGWISLVKIKLNVNWSNGLYGSKDLLTNVEEINNLYEYVVGNKMIFVSYYSQIYKATILFILMVSIFKELIKKDKEKMHSVIYISIFGAFIFYLIWEVQARYSLTFLPWMMLVFGIGITQIENLFNIKNIECKFVNDKVKVIDIATLRKLLCSSVIVCSIFLLVINYYTYAIKEDTYWDSRVVQWREHGTSKIKNLSKDVQQTFKTSKTFNSISIKFKKETVADTTHYTFKLINSKQEVIYEQSFTSDEVSNNSYKTFLFKKVKPEGEEEYTIKITSSDATDKNSIGIATFNHETYSAYPNGKLIIDGKETKCSFVFKVQNETIRTFTTKRVYISMSLLIIAIEMFALYTYIGKSNEKEN